jgi:tRNA A-37 threonylcarbamoyl transferase component Bud32
VAAALLESPPPLGALAVRCVSVDRTAVLHASGSRPVVRWELTVESEAGRRSRLAVVGKGFLLGGGEQAWWLLRRLREVGFDEPSLRVPQPYGYDPARRLLAQEEAPPQTLYEMLRGDVPIATPTVRRVARWLARLHAAPGVGLRELPTDFERSKLAEYGPALATALPAEADRITELVDLTLGRLAEAAADVPVVTHGDFQPKNVHLDPSRVVVIDFDRAASAPAARDLGHFVGQIETMGAALHGDLGVASSWVAAFLDEYVAGGGSPEAVQSTPGYVARTFAEVLYYRVVVRPVPDASFVPTWLDAWERHLLAEAHA